MRDSLERQAALLIPSPADWEQAWQAYASGAAGDAGIVDHVSFTLMRRLGIDTAFTNDQHFRAAGFVTLF